MLYRLDGILHVTQVPGVTRAPPLSLPSLFMRFIGVIELAGGLRLILSELARIRPGLTLLAALGLFPEMIGATAANLLGGKGAAALLPVAVGLLCAVVADRRRSWS